MKSFFNLSISQIAVSGAIFLLALYILYHFIPQLREGFGINSDLTGKGARLDRPLTQDNTQAMGSQQNSPGINATGKAESAPNPLRDKAPHTMATPYTEQPN